MKIQCLLIAALLTGCKHHTTYDVSTYSGATADVQINACLQSIPAGGICDATGYGATVQTISQTINVGAYPAITGFQRLLFSQATRFQPATPNLLMFRLGPYADVDGLHIDASNQPQFNNVMVLITKYLMLGNSTFVAAHLRNFILDGGTATPASGSVGIELITPDETASTYYVTVSDGSIGGLHTNILLYAPPNSIGGVNANSFSHLRLGRAIYSIELFGNSGFEAPALQLSGNNFTDVVAQASSITKAHVYIHGAASGNSFTSMQLYDSSAATILTVSQGTSANQNGIYGNHFQGWLYPIQDNAASGNTASINTWDCENCTNNESQRNGIKAKAVGVGGK